MRGPKMYRPAERITAEKLRDDLARAGYAPGRGTPDLYVLWTGDEYGRRHASGRSQLLYCLKELRRPVQFDDFATLVATCRVLGEDGEETGGWPTDFTRQALGLHQGAKPCAYLELRRRADGAFVASRPVAKVGPVAMATMGLPPSLNRGDVVIPAEEKVEPAKVEKVGKDSIRETAESKRIASAKRAPANTNVPAAPVARAAGAKGKRR